MCQMLVSASHLQKKEKKIKSSTLLDSLYNRDFLFFYILSIGIIARRPEYLPYIKRSLTESVMADYMQHLCKGSVKRFELPGLHALNFVLTHSLGKSKESSTSRRNISI